MNVKIAFRTENTLLTVLFRPSSFVLVCLSRDKDTVSDSVFNSSIVKPILCEKMVKTVIFVHPRYYIFNDFKQKTPEKGGLDA